MDRAGEEMQASLRSNDLHFVADAKMTLIDSQYVTVG